MTQDRTIILAIGADNAGVALKNRLQDQLASDRGLVVVDFGLPDATGGTACPHIGPRVAQAVARVIGPDLASRLVPGWLSYTFNDRSASAHKVAVISEYGRERADTLRARAGRGPRIVETIAFTSRLPQTAAPSSCRDQSRPPATCLSCPHIVKLPPRPQPSYCASSGSGLGAWRDGRETGQARSDG